MQVVLEQGSHRMLRFDRGEELLLALKEYCTREKIGAAAISAIGATEKLTLSWYDVDAKIYEDKDYDDKLEILSLQGNVTAMDGKSIVHVHGSFSDRSMQVVGGHVKRLVVGATCEMVLRVVAGVSLPRSFNEDVGLHLLHKA